MAGEPKQFVIYKSPKNGQWYWQLFAANGKQIADGSEGYVRKSDCIHGLRLVASIASGAMIWNRTDDVIEDG